MACGMWHIPCHAIVSMACLVHGIIGTHLHMSVLLVLVLALALLCLLEGSDAGKLVFNDKGYFKIAVFADLHYGEGENVDWGPEQDINSTRVMNKILASESPDFVVYSGDQITGENIGSNATAYWAKLVEPCVKTSTKWSMVFGNHDDLSVSGGTREDLLNFDTKFPLSYSQFGPKNIHGLTNYYLLIYSSKATKIPSWILYFLDSGGGSYPELVYEDQINWISESSKKLLIEFGPVPAVVFFHIPSTGYSGVFASDLCNGTNNDTVTPQIRPNKLLDQLFGLTNASMTVVGHDHGNDWCCHYKNNKRHHICFARHTGYGGYGTWARGSRVIVLQDSGVYSTHIRMEDGRII